MDSDPDDSKPIGRPLASPSLVGRALAAGGSSGRRLGRVLAPRIRPPYPIIPVAARAARSGIETRHIAMLIPALILASGVVTAVGAQLIVDSQARAVAALAPRTAPLIRAERAATAQADAIATLRPLLEGPTVSAQIERLARGMPDEVRIAGFGRDDMGRTTLSLLTADPDRLRGIAALSGFRQLDQRRDPSGRMLVLYQATGR